MKHKAYLLLNRLVLYLVNNAILDAEWDFRAYKVLVCSSCLVSRKAICHFCLNRPDPRVALFCGRKSRGSGWE